LVPDQDFHAPGMVTLVTNQGPWLRTEGLKCLVPDQDSHAPGMVTLVTNQGPWLLTEGLNQYKSQITYPRSALGALDFV